MNLKQHGERKARSIFIFGLFLCSAASNVFAQLVVDHQKRFIELIGTSVSIQMLD